MKTTFSADNPLKIAIVAGEASGDLLGSQLIQALRNHCPYLQIEGIGGPAMIASGCQSLFNIERLSIMGLVEPIRQLPNLIRLRSDLLKYFLCMKPHFFIGIDSPDFNLGLAKKLRQKGILSIQYVSPSVWAWRQYRINKIAKSIDLMLTLFPFEAKFYESRQVPVKYVGHPLADEIPLYPDKIAARCLLNLDENKTYIALLPGSRKQELHHLSDAFLRAAHLVWEQQPQISFITAQVNEARCQSFIEAFKRIAPALPLTFHLRRTHEVLAAADAVLVTSGTATLEAMLYKKPMVIAYKMPKIAYFLARLLVKSPFIGLPNLLAQEKLVPELIQHQASPENLAMHLLEYLGDPQKVASLEQKFLTLHQTLRQNNARQCAQSIMDLIQ